MIPDEVLERIAEAVQKVGGDLDDVIDLAQTWERLHREWTARVDAMRREAQNTECSCADEGEPGGDGRCHRCWGRLGVTGA